MLDNNSFDEVSFSNTEISLPRPARFWSMMIFNSLSILTNLFLLFHLLFRKKFRKIIGNHVIIILLVFFLIIKITDVPFYLAFILNGGIVKPSVPVICLIWWFGEFCLYNGGTILMAWMAFERHLIIFHFQTISSKTGAILFHYLPLTFIIAYIFVFYIYVLIIFPCENDYNYRLPVCNGFPCYQENDFLGKWDFLMNNICPSLSIAICNLHLLIRVVRQKQRFTQTFQWRRQRRLIIQLVAISTLNLIFNIPLNVISLAHLFGLPDENGVEAQQYFYFLCYFVVFFFPFVCLFSYPEICRTQLRRWCSKVRPQIMTIPTR